MTLHHSKTWPVNTLAVVQLRVDPNGRAYSTFTGRDIPELNTQTPQAYNEELHTEKSALGSRENTESPEPKNENGVILPLSKKHLELLANTSPLHGYKTIRTDTVSTLLDQELEADFIHPNYTGKYVLANNPDKNSEVSLTGYERIHILALEKIEENAHEPDGRSLCRRPSIKVDNWDLVFTEANGKTVCLQNRHDEIAMTACGCKCAPQKRNNEHTDRLLPDLPLDARKVTTLRRHYYPEGGWGWIVVVCSVLVHVLNNGVQLSCSQLVFPAAAKFKTRPVHVSENKITDKVK